MTVSINAVENLNELTFGLYGRQADRIRRLASCLLRLDHTPAELARQLRRDGGLKIESRTRLHDGTGRVGANRDSMGLCEMSHEVSLQFEFFAAIADCASKKMTS